MKIALICLGLCFSCATVSQIETLRESVPKPVFRVLEHGSVEPLPSLLDYKERLGGKSIPHFLLQWSELPVGTSKSDLNFLEDRIVTSHSPYGKYVSFPLGQKISESELKEKDIDVILLLKLEKIDNLLKLNVDYIDPVLSQKYGSTNYTFKYESDATNEKKNKRLEVFQSKKSLIPLRLSIDAYWSEVLSPDDAQIQSILSSTLRGQISVFSTSPGTLITMDGVGIGKAPLIDFTVLNGIHKLSFSKPGKDPENRTLIVRAGKKSRIFQEWNDDISQGTLFLTSYPSGLDVTVNGQKKGKTQYAESGVPYGSYPVEYIRSHLADTFQYAKAPVAIRPKSITTLSLPFALEEGISWEAEDFWTVSGGSPQFVASFPGSLNFQKKQELPLGWHGVFSQNLIPDKIESTLKLGVSQELNGRLGFLISDTEGKSALLIVDKTDFHVVSYSSAESDAPVAASYRWKSEEVEKGRTITWETDPEKQLLRIYLGRTMVLEKPWNFKVLWQIAILTPHNAFLSGNPLRGIKIHYPDMVKFEEKLKK
jgi:hypothetical protein